MHFDYQKELVQIWENAVELYRGGYTSSDTFPIQNDLPFLNKIGLSKMDIFDYVEDWVCEGTPDLGTFLLIHDLRREFFIEEQMGIRSLDILDSKTLPAKTEKLNGIVWLPRIICKARAKLRGELPVDTMFCCGGDRAFFRTNDIHPAEFLRIVKKSASEDHLIAQWVLERIKSS